MPDFRSSPRVAVVGAGAMGAILGVALAKGGTDVALLDVAAPLIAKIRSDGVSVERDGETTTVRPLITSKPADVGVVDYVVFFVKCYQTAAAAAAASPLVGPETAIVTLQNGWGNGEELAAHFGPDRVLIGVTYNSGTVRDLGVVAHTGIGPTFIGPYEPAQLELAERFAELSNSGGLETTVTAEIETEIWKKLILNAATLPTAALTGLASGPLEELLETRGLVDMIADEAVSVARARGYHIDADERKATIHGILERAGGGKASMLQDFEAGRRSEIDVINGAVVRAGDDVGVAVPINRALVALVKGWERSRGLT